MESLVPIALFGFIPLFFIAFLFQRSSRTVLYGFILGWLFLPVYTYEAEGFPDIDKLAVICFAIGLAVLLTNFGRLIRFRPHWIDLPMVLWCLVPIASSLSNGLGLYDGLSEAFAQTLSWGVPWFLGRIYFKTWDDLKGLAVGLVIGGLLYLPLLLFEMRFSPQLHRFVYGFHQHQFNQTLRFGGWRPMVFMQHGLMTAFWVSVVAITTTWMWYAGTIKKIWGIPISWLSISFILMTVLMRSVNAWLWLILGLSLLFLSNYFRTKLFVWLVISIIPLYILGNMVELWPQETAIRVVTGLIGPERAQSLEFRYFNEAYLVERAREQILFGWAGWDRQHVFFEWGPQRTIADSLWVIVLGKFGFAGLLLMLSAVLLPIITFMNRFSPWTWSYPTAAPAAAFGIILILYMADGLLNAMLNPVYLLVAGAVVSVAVGEPLFADNQKRSKNDPLPPASLEQAGLRPAVRPQTSHVTNRSL